MPAPYMNNNEKSTPGWTSEHRKGMNRPNEDNDSQNQAGPWWVHGGEAQDDSALQVLAAAATNDQLSGRYHGHHGDPSSPSPSSVLAGSLDRDKRGVATIEGSDDHREAGGKAPSGGSSGNGAISKWTALRGGKWSAEEEEYATRLILYFSTGVLTLPEGTTLRAVLAEKLRCDPMRITKKYAGAGCLGKQVSTLCGGRRFSPQYVDIANSEIARLERRFQLRLALGLGAPLPPESPESVSGKSDGAPSYLPEVNIGQTSEIVNVRSSASPRPVKANAPGVPVMHRTAKLTANPPPAASPYVSSWLAKVLHNSRLAAASLSSPNVDPMLAGVPHSMPAPSVGLQPPIMRLSYPQQPIPQAPLPPMSLPVIFPSTSQALDNTTTSSVTPPAPVNNDQLIQTLLTQIIPKMQSLATQSSPALMQIQHQINAATLASSPVAPSAPKAPIHVTQVPLPQTSASPATISGADTAPFLGDIELATDGKLSTGLQTMLPTNTRVQNLLHEAQPTVPLFGPYETNTLGVEPKNAPSNPVFSRPQGTPQVLIQAKQEPLQKRARSTLVRQANGTLSNTLSSPNRNNLAELVFELRQGHNVAVEQVGNEQTPQFRRGEDTASEGGCAFRKGTSLLISSHIDSTSVEGPLVKKQRLEPSSNGEWPCPKFSPARELSESALTSHEAPNSFNGRSTYSISSLMGDTELDQS